ncbi:MAG TPA: polyprenyl diphosphate synthase [Deltaproteobacteria bacterium]|nr:polyprenyl diphosphate synthase [Deltaproteobacteria bacterium]HPR54879.1 polyprenyl diphosphate synthase [Deltaproteobacteria bacterium]HXK48518.1 polyprenyl diphosphate synthase [Deltaproteobacteria bacterium]
MQNRINHLAIIMDGNGRWAQRQGLSRLRGHEMGARAAKRVVELAKARSIRYLTLYAFSSENWNRPKEEVEGLFRLMERFIAEEVDRLKSSGICIHVIGDLSRFSTHLQDTIRRTLDETKDNRELHLAIALNYGGRDEIVRSTRKLLTDGVHPEEVTEETFSSLLDTSFMPDPDLLVRTGGEWRISNFLLWQLAYTEIYFTDTLWPDFDEKELDKAVDWYGGRQRRFGMTGEQVEGGTQ